MPPKKQPEATKPKKKVFVKPRFMSEKPKMHWVEATMIYNQGKPGYCLPKRGTKEYMEIQRIMRTGKK